MNDKKNVAVIFGGVSPEHEVSCRSAAFVFSCINTDKYNPYLIGISKNAEYYFYNADISHLYEDWEKYGKKNSVVFDIAQREFYIKGENRIDIDVVFPVIHGPNGEDGKLQGALNCCGLPFVGCDVISSAVCMDKDVAKRLFVEAGLKIVPYFNIEKKLNANHLKQAEILGYPLFVKPANMGSSVGIYKVNDENELKKAVELSFKYDSKLLVEKAIDAFELETAALEYEEDVIISTVGEINLKKGFYDYKSKYETDDADFFIPAEITPEESETIKHMAKKAFHATCCKGLSRVDFFMDRNTRQIYINEINTMPGFTKISLYPQLMEFDGIPAKKLIDILIDNALKREN